MPKVTELMSSNISNTLRNIETWKGGMVNVKSYGARGDGVVSDSEAIQQALNIALKEPVHVYIPNGVYKLTSILRIYSDTRLTLESGAIMLRCHNASFMMNGDYGAQYHGYDGHGNIIIEGGFWDGNILEFPDDFSGINLGHGRNITVRDLVMKDIVFGHCFDVSGCEDVLIENCRFLGYKDPGGREDAEAIQISTHTELGFPAFGAYDDTPCRNITIRNCYFGASGTPGTTAWAVGVGSHGSVQGVYDSDIKVIGCTFEGMTYAGVRMSKFAESIVADNIFLGCQRGVVISNPSAYQEASRNIIIANNQFINNIGSDIEAAAWFPDAKMQSINVHGNVFHRDEAPENNVNSVYFRFVDSLSISNNTFKNSDRCLYLAYGSNFVFKGNVAEDTLFEVIYMTEPDPNHQGDGHLYNHIIDGNIVQNTGRHAFYIAHVKGFIVTNNFIASPATEVDNNRSGILASSSASDGFVAHNVVRMAQSGNQNRYGFDSTASVSNIRLFNNDFEGKSGHQNLAGTNMFDGFYITDSNDVRYTVTVDTTGNLVVSP